MSGIFKGYDLGNLLDDADGASITSVSVEVDIMDDNAIGMITTVEEKPVGPLDQVEKFTVRQRIGRNRVTRKIAVVFRETARGVAANELHEVYGSLARPTASPTKGTVFDPARHRPR